MELKRKKERDFKVNMAERFPSDSNISRTDKSFQKEKGALESANGGGRGKGGKLWKAAGVVLEVSESSRRMMGEEEQKNPYLDAKVTDMLAYVSKTRAAEKTRKKKAEYQGKPVSESDTFSRCMGQSSPFQNTKNESIQKIQEMETVAVRHKIQALNPDGDRTVQTSIKGNPPIAASKAAERYLEEKKKTEGNTIQSVKGRTGKDAGRKTSDSIQRIQIQAKAAETARQTGHTAAAKSSTKTSILTFAEAAWKAVQKIKREGFGKEKEEREMRGDERELAQHAQAAAKSNAQKTGNFLVFLLFGIPVAPILFVLIVLCLILAGSGSVSSGTGLSAQYDKACYLAAKYESGGNPDQTGGDGGNACGEFQFDNRYELGPFVSWCYEKDPTFYAAFQPFLGMTTELKSNEDFYQAWHTVCAANKEVFEAAQCEYVYTYTLMPLLQAMTEHYGFDFVNCSDALKGCILSFGNRDGKYVASIRRYFDGTTEASTDREIIERAYNAMIQRRPSIRRWRLEKQDCLALLDGSLDVYAPSENAAGSIDWSWKRIAGGSEVGNQVAQLAVSKVGCGYSQAHRDEEGWYDCSSLVYRCYAEAGITCLNGLTAAEEARYLVEHGMTVSREELQPGDIIFYSYEANGRYRNISHVAIYIGNNEMVHAANTKRGVVRDPLRESNLAEPLYCRPQ